MRLPALVALLPLLAQLMCAALPARAADEPEAVYGKYHRAVMAGDIEEMFSNSPARLRAEMRSASASTKDAALKMAQYLMPRAFTVQRKTMLPNGRAVLIVSGPWADEGRVLETMYGTVRMVIEDGNWKVDELSWSNEKPAGLGAPKPAAPPVAADKPAPKGTPMKGAAASAPAAAPAAPERKLGAAQPDCVYKPVMTAKDLENCK